jgi:hypothetical protein
LRNLLIIAAVGTILATPALAQQYPNGRYRTFHQESSVEPYAADRYAAPRYERNNNANQDFQLGGER